ncbi:PaaI family thioesterase [Cuniculiplasma sp. SKW3]|uniref:PaaI family thioesterase n=1 Tax=Cuniculiplasma sp. SKW3 TaxID=3400170 RepID=UPI003FD3283F
MEREERLRALIDNDNFMKRFKIELLETKEGYVDFKILIEENMLRMGEIVNGGIILGLFDIAGALTIFTLEGVVNGFTISLNTNFMRSLSGNYARVVSELKSHGKTHAFIHMNMYNDEGENTAVANGVWGIYR